MEGGTEDSKHSSLCANKSFPKIDPMLVSCCSWLLALVGRFEQRSKQEVSCRHPDSLINSMQVFIDFFHLNGLALDLCHARNHLVPKRATDGPAGPIWRDAAWFLFQNNTRKLPLLPVHVAGVRIANESHFCKNGAWRSMRSTDKGTEWRFAVWHALSSAVYFWTEAHNPLWFIWTFMIVL